MLAATFAVIALFLAMFAVACAIGRFIAVGMQDAETERLIRERLDPETQRLDRVVYASSLRSAS